MSHIHELYDFTVSASIVWNKSVLLIHHKKLSIWVQPGGHIELDETPIEALWRELEEETGLPKSKLHLIDMSSHGFASTKGFRHLPMPFDIFVHEYGDTNHQHIDLSYLVSSDTGQLVKNHKETNDIRWFSEKDLKTEPLQDKVREHALFALGYLK